MQDTNIHVNPVTQRFPPYWSILNEDTETDVAQDAVVTSSCPATVHSHQDHEGYESQDEEDYIVLTDDGGDEEVEEEDESKSKCSSLEQDDHQPSHRSRQDVTSGRSYPEKRPIEDRRWLNGHVSNVFLQLTDHQLGSCSHNPRAVSNLPHSRSSSHSIPRALGPSNSPFNEDEDEDDDAIMQRLMAQARERQNANHEVDQEEASRIRRESRSKEDQESSRKAAKFLEALCLDFLEQVYTSQRAIDSRHKLSRMTKKNRKKSGSRKREFEEGEASADEYADRKLEVSLSLKNRKTGGYHCVSFPDDLTLAKENQLGRSMLRLARILCVASLLYEACLTGVTTTKRDIFYKDVRLFGNQAVVDNIVDDIVATAGLKRRHFNVCAASKGLIVTNCLEIMLKSGDRLPCSGTTAALIVPVERVERIEATSPPKWVLIVEKDAIFQPLCAMKLLDLLGPGVIVTGKGYPDLATLQLLALIADHYPATKFYGLFDADPHGLDILSIYTHGSQASRYSHDHSDLPLGDRLRWIGVKSSELISMGLKHDDLIPLTEKDVQKANAMLRHPLLRDDCKRELVHMLHLDRKAEIQIILGAESVETEESVEAKSCGPALLMDYVVRRIGTV
ncbi:Spo11/DNA topoisomerase VI subunit A [Kockovaella imperatae]|uniref:DNA topoisomerase (ATP-hydrolyzing) n=1 Tax=Kockovaella imperatae TaxID=4999 RepID=A0A1Y1UG17_9TREE|nr:Spo11/DNA topoisomerase VI subunit A [Kockovaella imperatae]ORX36919.1 Spo11/DNA topoisomerase VI subunit A [Kockovaella imperatae]